jgi:hypothetical protein
MHNLKNGHELNMLLRRQQQWLQAEHVVIVFSFRNNKVEIYLSLDHFLSVVTEGPRLTEVVVSLPTTQ